MFDRDALPRILPFAIYIFFIFIADLLERVGFSARELRWLYAVKVLVVAAVLLCYRRRYTELAWREWRAVGWWTALATGLAVWVLWINLNADWMQIGSSSGFDPRNAGRLDWLLIAVRVAGAALVVPVMEELFWRSYLMRWLESADFLNIDPALVKTRGFVVTMVLFGFEHSLWLAGIVAGAAYGLLYMRSRNLCSVIVAHGVTNGVLGLWVVATGSWAYW